MMFKPWLMSLFASLTLASTGASAAPAAGPDALKLASVNAAVAYAGEDKLLYGKHATRSVPIASLTKLMMALVVLDSGEPLKEWLEVFPRHKTAANNAYSRIRRGSELRRRDMLRIALMSSENLAAYTLARHHPGGYDKFVSDMNKMAEKLAMTNSRFVDPTGLSANNHASAADLVKLVNAAAKHPEIGDYSTTEYFRAHFRQPRYSLPYGNTNALVHRKSWGVGLSKTGYLTEAGRCLVMVSQMNGKAVTTVLLDSFGTRSPMGDAGRVKRWLATGDSGRVAGAAKAYEQRKNAQYAGHSSVAESH
ncbi:D-alanyl-D-alanine endopeptidase [Marinobacter caseinilyticus]|uniref:D-alanyl-D-alanine endopeptidase n=1 Tax=Marinobacter caseinilyticus TaxID=2692195 RepID=UPI001F17009B|nr:D-alanyl-D-alanine endopeptidase [Marinobacter caseinilyticus]